VIIMMMGMRTIRRRIAVEIGFPLRFQNWRSKASLRRFSQSSSNDYATILTLAARAPSRDGESVFIGAVAGGSGTERGLRGRSCNVSL
jgi:hypothetical protein